MHLQIKVMKLSAFFSRFLVLCLIAAVMAGTIPAASADLSDVGEYYTSNLWSFLLGGDFDWGGTFWNNVVGYAVGQECPSSPDRYHHGTPAPLGKRTGGTDEKGRYTLVDCDYCHKQFKAYGGFTRGEGAGLSSDFEQSYDVNSGKVKDDLGTTVLSSANTLLWSPAHAWTLVATVASGNRGVYCSHYAVDLTGPLIEFNCVDGAPNFFVSPTDGKSTFEVYKHKFSYSSPAPVTGNYRLLAGNASVLHCTGSGSSASEETYTYKYKAASAGTSYSKGAVISYTYDSPFLVSSSFATLYIWKSYYAQGYAPVYEVTPASELLPAITQNYNIQSRFNSYQGDFGIIGDNGEITKIDKQYIVNEIDNSVYNPVTNTTNTVASWNYDYSSRTYNFT